MKVTARILIGLGAVAAVLAGPFVRAQQPPRFGERETQEREAKRVGRVRRDRALEKGDRIGGAILLSVQAAEIAQWAAGLGLIRYLCYPLAETQQGEPFGECSR